MISQHPSPDYQLQREWDAAEGYLRRAQHILAITHLSPDGDALGSLLGFTLAMRGMGKHVTPACQDSAQIKFDYLSGAHEIRQSADGNYDLIVSLDASDLQRLGEIFIPGLHARLPIVVFDHHITNTMFGTVNVIEPNVSSTSELVLKLLRRLDLPVTPDIASALLTGIVTDSLAFRTSNTTPDTLAAAMELMRTGVSLAEITRRSLVLRSYDSLRFMAAGIMASQMEDGIAWACITRKLRKELGTKDDRGDGNLVGTLITAMEAHIAAVFVETSDGTIEIGFRSAPGYDVSQVAFELGGGGHPAAAGCTIPGPMRDAVNRVLPRLRQVIREA